MVADHDHPRVAGDRVDAETDRPAAEPGKVEEPAGLVGVDGAEFGLDGLGGLELFLVVGNIEDA